MSGVLDSYCGSEFWNDSYLERSQPDLPVCFEQTVLVWVPLGFLWICAPFLLSHLFRHPSKRLPVSGKYAAKQAFTALLLATAVARLAVTIAEDSGSTAAATNPVVLYVNPSLYIATWLLVLLINESGRRAGLKTSGVLFLFWLFSVLCEILPFQTLIRKAIDGHGDVARLSLFYISFGLQLSCLVMSGFADLPKDHGAIDDSGMKPSPEENASFLNQITFTWFDSMVYRGYKKPLEVEDLWGLNEEDTAERIFSDFDRNWELELERARKKQQRELAASPSLAANGMGKSTEALAMEPIQKDGDKKKSDKKKKKSDKRGKLDPSLLRALFFTYGWVLLESGIFKLIYDLLTFVSPQILKLLIGFTEDQNVMEWKGYFYAILLFVTALVQSLLLQQYFQRCFLFGMRVRTAVIGAVYKKSLIMSNAARKDSTIGETVNLMSADAQRFMDVASFMHLLWSAPLQIVISLVFLWIELGPSVMAGFAVMVLLIPFNAVLATRSRALQVKNMNEKDKRIKLMNEILNGIKILKYFAWETSFEQKIGDIRNRELKVMRSFSYLNAVSIFSYTCTPFFVSLASFGVFVAVSKDNVLDAQKVFTSISLFNVLHVPLVMLPMLISYIVQASVSTKRVKKFLSNDELDTSAVTYDSNLKSAILIENASFTWDKGEEATLNDVSVEVPVGSLVAVVGQVGAGKSSLIAATLGEMEKLQGTVAMKGSVAYVPQQAWIQNCTLQQNVLFGLPLEPERYARVIDACALSADLKALPAGDQTEIGEKGINLSGGQKQRVSLARAVYSDADVFLLDDPLSAVDAHVGKHIFTHVIGPTGILKNKTRLLVTHSVSFLSMVDQIVVLQAGRVSEIGTYKQLVINGEAFAEFLRIYDSQEKDGDKKNATDLDSVITTTVDIADEPDPEPQGDDAYEDSVSSTFRRERSMRLRVSTSRKRRSHKKHSARNSTSGETALLGKEQDDKAQKLIEKEGVETGNVKWSVYMQYMRSTGLFLSFLIFMGNLLQNAAVIGQNFWLSDWTFDAASYPNVTYGNDMRLGVYGALGVAQGLFVFLATFITAKGTIEASRVLHRDLLGNMLHAPMAFYDTTPIGRIVNRFAKDINTIDDTLPMSFRSWISCAFGVLSTVLVICIATPLFAAVIVPIAIFYFFVQRFYVSTSRQLRRLDSVTRSPIYSHFGETVQGLSVIRAYRHLPRFLAHNVKIVDVNQVCVFPWIVSNRWLAIRLEFTGNLVVFFAALFAVLARGTTAGGVVGLSISYALNVTQTLNWLVRQTCELETNVVAVERVSEYTEIDREAAWETETRPPSEWPDRGQVEFVDYSTRYRPELELVLKGISFSIQPGEKVGIVGRTGAGKSSLTSCLFRMMEAAGGSIRIDGIDIAPIGLHDLRSKLTIIPQDPVLFSGPLRMNLDPFGHHSDEELWSALEMAHLKAHVRSLEAGLDHPISEGGENLSVGQRQLVCLARALLRKSRILILDEATAAVDLETDDLIQATIRRECQNRTVLTIAHRLNTVIDYTRVMVLDGGCLAEFDSPAALLKKRGIFYTMAKDAGLAEEKATHL
ncbi:ATP-binding cassette sub-family C member 2-like [Lampetra planeri]